MTNQRANGALSVSVSLRLLGLVLVVAGLTSWLMPGSAGSSGSKVGAPAPLPCATARPNENTLSTSNLFGVSKFVDLNQAGGYAFKDALVPLVFQRVVAEQPSSSMHVPGESVAMQSVLFDWQSMLASRSPINTQSSSWSRILNPSYRPDVKNPQPAMSFTVTNTIDSGAGSLRQAILDANANPGTDTIAFNILGPGVHTIKPTSLLPIITDPVIINGYTQPGTSQNTLQIGDNAVIQIELDGSSVPAESFSGFRGGFTITAGNSTVRGLVINRFTGNFQDFALLLQTNGGNVIEGNFIGTNTTGSAAASGGVTRGIGVFSSSNNTIGGTVPSARNVISGNNQSGIYISSNINNALAANNLVQGNLVGTNAAGTGAVGNSFIGILIEGSNTNTVGGTSSGTRNIISGNGGTAGILITNGATGNQVQGNFIGTNAAGTSPLPNTSNGLFLSNVSGNTIGGIAPGAGNTIAFNPSGLIVSGGGSNAILSNSFHSNGDPGIVLQNGANNSQAPPVITSVTSSGGFFSVQGNVTGPPNTTGIVQLFANDVCDPSGSGEGQIFLGSAQAEFGANGSTSGPGATLPGTVAPGQVVTATTTDVNNNTSAFSVCQIVSTSPHFKISGRVLDGSGNGIGGVTVTLTVLSGGQTGTAMTDANGNYSFASVEGGSNYLVTPSHSSYSFSPANQTFNNLNVDRIANFVGTQTIVSITGKVTDSNNVGINNVAVSLSKNGIAAGNTQTDGLGNYSFGNLAVGANYVVTPTGSFTPSSQTFSNLGTNATANFKAAPGIPSQCNTASFTAASNFAAGSGPGSVAVGDFNGDGKLDLAVTNTDSINVSSNVSIFLGTGTGSFSAATNFAVGVTPRSVAVGDFNDDGKLDLAVANNTSNNVSILLGTGTGSFSAATNFAVGGAARSVAVGDFTGDGKLDLAVPNSSDNVSILLGTGTGSFSAATNFASSGAFSVAVGDFNGDGKLDLAVANFSSDNVSILLGTGTGSFSAATNFAVGSGSAPIFVAVGDFNSDGKLDLAVANNAVISGSPSVSILLGTGTGSFSAATNFAVGSAPQSVAVGDFNGDGKLDLAVANASSANVSILLGTGTGSFSAATNFAASSPRSVAVGDFNGDGKLDLAAANSGPDNVSILLNNGSICNTLTSLTIFGQITDAGNKPLSNVTVTLSGPITRVAQSDVSGNYSFANLTPGGNYSVTLQSPYFIFAPSRADFFNLSSSQTANFTAAPVAVPSPTPPPSDDFTSPTRDATKWSIGTQTQPVGSFDPQVTTAQINGQLVITPLTQASGLHYDGYVSANSFDMRNGAASVELVKAATGGADTIFAIGTDSDNFFRFLVHTAGAPTSLAPTAKGRDGIERPLDTTTAQLIFQVKINGVLTSVSIPYDPVQHRFMRFRHEPATNSIVFETSPNNIDFTVQNRVVLQKGVSALTVELSAGTSSPTNPGQTIFDNFNLVTSTFQFSAAGYTVGEGDGSVLITVTRAGGTGAAATVDYTTGDGTAQQRNKYIPAVGTLRFAAGETIKSFQVLIEDNVAAEGNQTVNLLLGNPVGSGLNSPGRAVLTIVDNDTVQATSNPLDDPTFFAHQHYLDFLNRQPDASGLAFWTNEITSCGTNQQCIDVKRINVSGAFFVSIEFQQTGYLVERIYKVSYGDAIGTSTLNGAHQLPVPIIRLNEFLPDTQEIGQGVVVNQGNWQQQLENNKQAFTAEFVQRARFKTAFSTTLTPAQFVDRLFTNAGVTPSASDRTAAINEFGSATTTADTTALARALRDVAENSILTQQESNRAFVLMQYLGYLRRNPNDPQDSDYTGYDFWLTKLNQFNGNFQNAEMVKAFISSLEYRQRFGP